jgi:hypothetical protein
VKKPIPKDWGWRYVLWAIWSNMITILAIIQGTIAYLMLEQDIFTHQTFRSIVIVNAALTGIVAQFKKNVPPSPRPLKKR